jgi:hypothetical protein
MKFTRHIWLLLATFAVGCQDAPPSDPQTKTPVDAKDTAEPKFDLSEPPLPSDGSEKSSEKTEDKPAAEPVAGEGDSADTTPASATPE